MYLPRRETPACVDGMPAPRDQALFDGCNPSRNLRPTGYQGHLGFSKAAPRHLMPVRRTNLMPAGATRSSIGSSPGSRYFRSGRGGSNGATAPTGRPEQDEERTFRRLPRTRSMRHCPSRTWRAAIQHAIAMIDARRQPWKSHICRVTSNLDRSLWFGERGSKGFLTIPTQPRPGCNKPQPSRNLERWGSLFDRCRAF